MREFTYRISDPMGLHARPAGLMVRIIHQNQANVTLNFQGKKADGKRLYQVMSLGVKQGDEIVFQVEGDDEEATEVAILALFEQEKL